MIDMDIRIDFENILKFYSHKTKRWDIYFNNNILLKLPSENIINSLKLFNKLQKLNKIKPNSDKIKSIQIEYRKHFPGKFPGKRQKRN